MASVPIPALAPEEAVRVEETRAGGAPVFDPDPRALAKRRILRRALRLYAAHWRELVPIAFAVYAVLALVPPLVVLFFEANARVLVPLFYLAGGFWLQGALVQTVENVRRGRRDIGVRATLEQLWPRINTLSAAGILAATGIYATSLAFLAPGVFVLEGSRLIAPLTLLVVPGLVLLGQWSLIVPAVVVENAGVFRAFRRSRALIRGYSAQVARLTAVTIALVFAAWLASAVVTALVEGAGTGSDALVGGVAGACTIVALSVATPLAALIWTVVYYELQALQRAQIASRAPTLRAWDALDAAWDVYKRHPARHMALAAGVFLVIALAHVAVAPAGISALPVTLAITIFGVVVLQGPIASALEEPRELRAWELAARLVPRPAGLAAAVTQAAAVYGIGLAVVVGARPAFAVVTGSAGAETALVAAALSVAVAAATALVVYTSAVGPSVLVDRCGIRGCARRSVRLVSGHARGVIQVLVMPVVVAAVAAWFVAGLLPPVEGGLWDYVTTVVLNTVTAPYVAIAWTLMYFQLRDMSDTRPR